MKRTFGEFRTAVAAAFEAAGHADLAEYIGDIGDESAWVSPLFSSWEYAGDSDDWADHEDAFVDVVYELTNPMNHPPRCAPPKRDARAVADAVLTVLGA